MDSSSDNFEAPRDKRQDPPPPNPSEEEKGEEEEEEEEEGEGQKTLERAEELFDRGSKAIEEGDFVDAVDCLSRALEIRVACYGELAPECASTSYKYGCALLYKAQEETDPLGNVPKSSPDEESVKSTTNKDDSGNSKASGSNVQDAPSSDKGATQEEMSHLVAPASPPLAPNPSLIAGEEASCSSPPSERGRRKAVVVVMGATGAGKSRLAVDLAAHFTGVEVVSADSMQVYRGLDVLTNKVPLHEQNGVPHHLLSIIDPSVEFTCRDFRDHAVPVIEDILDRGGLPVIVGGTNFYIQALVSPFLFDDMAEDMQGCTLSAHLDDIGIANDDEGSGYERLKDIDPVAAQRIHPNNHRKIKRYLELYATTGALPSDLFQGEAAEVYTCSMYTSCHECAPLITAATHLVQSKDKWGRPSNSRFDCCFLWVDADLHVLDSYVNERVDSMISAGLLDEVCNVYDPDAVYTQGLRQAIGVREFDEFFRLYLRKKKPVEIKAGSSTTTLDLHDGKLKSLLDEAVSQLKANTRRLVRRQRRRLHRLNKDFGWNLHHIDATEAFQCTTGTSWHKKVVKPCTDIVKRFLSNDTTLASKDSSNDIGGTRVASRDLWTQYVCMACDNRVLRGAHEWEQHKQGRVHRKRVQRSKQKSKVQGAAFGIEA